MNRVRANVVRQSEAVTRGRLLNPCELNYPSIVTIHDFDTQQGMDFLVMDYIPRITPSEKLAGSPQNLQRNSILTDPLTTTVAGQPRKDSAYCWSSTGFTTISQRRSRT